MTTQRHIALIALLLGTGGVLALPSGCLTCDDIGCTSGFEWTGQAEDGSPLPLGEYEIVVTLDGAAYEVACVVVHPADGLSECNTVSPPGGSFDVEVGVVTNSEVIPLGFSLYAVNDAATERSGGLGPQSVTIAANLAGASVFAADYEVEYEVDEDYWGDRRCGTCEFVEAREHTW